MYLANVGVNGWQLVVTKMKLEKARNSRKRKVTKRQRNMAAEAKEIKRLSKKSLKLKNNETRGRNLTVFIRVKSFQLANQPRMENTKL